MKRFKVATENIRVGRPLDSADLVVVAENTSQARGFHWQMGERSQKETMC